MADDNHIPPDDSPLTAESLAAALSELAKMKDAIEPLYFDGELAMGVYRDCSRRWWIGQLWRGRPHHQRRSWPRNYRRKKVEAK